uniref:NADH-ubiquinone oxidoreductase chain 6 n=1 Tax=Attagenus augustatus augustatus TaxID=2783534 RepID=A0A7S6UAZ9_9COLE|nr:NADH dehydrogenase subunit 6 [Attagenus augustatus augustatus]
MSMMVMTSLSISLSSMFLLMKHPMSMGTTLLLQTLLMTMLTGFFFENFWYSYILFLIMVGGMLVLFIYMTSIASNEKFKLSMSMTLTLTLLMLTSLMMMMTNTNELFTKLTEMNMQDMELWFPMKMWELSMIKFFMEPGNKMFILIMIMLLMALIAVVKITSISHGALRQKI